MTTSHRLSSRVILAGVWATLLLVLIANARAAERQVLRGHLVRAVSELNLQPVGRLETSTNLDLVIGLPLRNQEALANLLQQQYAPASPQYHHWLTPDEFATKFGPTEQDYQAVIGFAKANGFTVTGMHSNRTLVDVRGSVAEIERTFRVTLLTYQHPAESREFYAPDIEPSLDKIVPILHISGLNNYILPHPLTIRVGSQNTTANMAPATGSGPSGSYLGYDFRAAYAPGVSLTGAGQALALVEFGGYYTNDITQYENLANLPNVKLTNVIVDGFTDNPATDSDSEEPLDIEMAIAMAPGLSEVLVYEAPADSNTDDILNQIAVDNLASQVSSSWTYAMEATIEQIYQQYAAQGQSFFQSSGDNGAYASLCPSQAQADSPYATLVGGTTLTTTVPGGTWFAETVWNQCTGTAPCDTKCASGGGISTNYTVPSWQQGIDMTLNQGSTSMRNVPDVAMVADGIYVIYDNGSTISAAGTSCAAPLWAGFTALVNQQAAANGQTTVGFINPAIYSIGKGVTYNACFHDITTGNNETYYSPSLFSAVPGYDLCTGWGTPTGSDLINTLLATRYAFTNTPLWDVSGIYTNSTADSNDVVIGDFQQQANGKITGLRTVTDVDGADHVEESGPLTGATFVRAGVVGANVKYTGVITGVLGGVDIAGTYSIKEIATIVPSSLTVFFSDSDRQCVVGRKCVTQTGAVSLPLPAGMDGDWELDISVTANGNKRTGTGTLTLSNGRVLTYQIIGSYNTRSQLSKLKLIGEGDAHGTSLSLTADGTGTNLVTLKGKILGQPLKYP